MSGITFFPVLIGGSLIAFLVSVATVVTKKYHGKLTLDNVGGVQKTHDAPTPRVGGISLVLGFAFVWFFLDGEAQKIWGYIGVAGVPAFAFGLAEDITGKIGVKWRLLATIISGLIFSVLAGYAVTSVGIWGLDGLLATSIFAALFTAFAVGGVANSFNIIDGFHGLASGTMILVLSAFAVICWRIGDMELMTVSLVMASIVFGFFLVNFPFGKLFLGDAGAYFGGFVIATIAVMLPARNPEISSWISLLILWYPITETITSIVRRTLSDEGHPGQPDCLHLHSLVHKTWVDMAADYMSIATYKNALTGMFMWQFSMLPLIFVTYGDFHSIAAAGYLVSSIALYLSFYRSVSGRIEIHLPA